MKASKDMQQYFAHLEKECVVAYQHAQKARQKGFDPEPNVEVSLAKNMAERVIGLVSVVVPQLKDSDADKRILALEQQYGILDWRVALVIAEEVAREKFCQFNSQKEAIEAGIRVGFAYVTLGVVSSPLEGFVSLDIKKRLDGKGDYFCLNFSGPIRNAGGTAASVCVIIGDYLRVAFGFEPYDATELEVKRCFTELEDYHGFVTNLQYFPSHIETEFMMKNLPVEISGDPSEKYEVSNYKDLPRIPTNRLRSGYCLIHSSCIPLKAPKLWKELSKWGSSFKLGHWNFLEEFLKIQKKVKAQGVKSSEKISPDYTYIKDLVAGRPVLGHPLRSGAFRLRYGRGRVSGYSGQSIHPATMHVLNNYIATATQLKVERPGKATSLSCCDTIEGPLVKLKNGDVLLLETEALARQYKNEVLEVLYAGDVLINYGDFFNRAHVLVPPGYCEEYWIQEFEEKAIELFGTLDYEKISDLLGSPLEKIQMLFAKPLETKLSFRAAETISRAFGIPLHPGYTYYWKTITKEQLLDLITLLKAANIVREDEKIKKITLPKTDAKRVLELLGVPHLFVNQEYVLLDHNHGEALLLSLGVTEKTDVDALKETVARNSEKSVLEIVNLVSSVRIKDKGGVFIGSRMGRPEKAKMRKLTGSPHGLFPVGKEGGKMRSFNAALEIGKITSDFPLFHCEHCGKNTVFSVCEVCRKKTVKLMFTAEGDADAEGTLSYKQQAIDLHHYFDAVKAQINLQVIPDLIKGIRGTSNADHIPEHLAKALLRAKHDIFVNKDGTTRYDASEIALTHFKPKEVEVSVEKLKSLGYQKDIYGKTLENENQILEIKPQDVILPACLESPDEASDDVLFRTAQFIDDLLVRLYGIEPFYKLNSKEGLIGQLVVGLAPHTSAGSLGRIIGFSKTQGFIAHPYFHAAMRRDVDGDESCVFLLMDAFLNYSKHYLPDHRGSTMDAPLVLTSVLNPAEVDDMAFHVDIAWKYPLKFYRAAENFKMPWEVSIRQIQHVLGTEQQFESMGFTHDTSNLNAGVLCSQYKLLPSMEEKLKGQMDIAVKLRAVDETDVARLVIEKHFIRDIKGNLRKFSMQQFRCVNCNEKYRRPPLLGKCLKCDGKIIFTISEGSILKYLEPSLSIAKAFQVPKYLQHNLELLKRQVESYFGKDDERQEGLQKWFG
ncbi:DNA polymerase II large subunit [Candidatus Woesearchaeota archaeon]|nr:MAG: DNA polymerase II large subunit [Candidatus Woesearchaeota archaeon]